MFSNMIVPKIPTTRRVCNTPTGLHLDEQRFPSVLSCLLVLGFCFCLYSTRLKACTSTPVFSSIIKNLKGILLNQLLRFLDKKKVNVKSKQQEASSVCDVGDGTTQEP